MTNWDGRFLHLAQTVASWSKDPSTKVGAVIVRPDRTVASMGFNGFPRGVSDKPALYANREAKLRRTIHAEMNAILSAHEPVRRYTLYCTHPVCDRCAPHIIQAGIQRVVTPPQVSDEFADRWRGNALAARAILREAGVQLLGWMENP